MKISVIKINTLLFAACCMFFACGDDGDPGPQGPQGEQGVEGPQGEQGEPGTANVIYSDWIPSGFPDGFLTEKEFNIFLPDDLPFNGFTDVLLVFGRTNDNDNAFVRPLPYSDLSAGLYYSYFFRGNIDEDIDPSIRIIGRDDNGGFLNFFISFRYVIIPGGVEAVSDGRVKAPVDYNNYEAVKSYYNIPN